MLVYALIAYNSDTCSESIVNIYKGLSEANEAMDNYNDSYNGDNEDTTAHVAEFELK